MAIRLAAAAATRGIWRRLMPRVLQQVRQAHGIQSLRWDSYSHEHCLRRLCERLRHKTGRTGYSERDRSGSSLLVVSFAFEICLKLSVPRLYFLCNGDMVWNMFDLLLVLMSLLDVSATIAAESAGGGIINLTFARVWRIFTVGRILRMLRAVRFLKALSVILTNIIHSFATFVWSLG